MITDPKTQENRRLDVEDLPVVAQYLSKQSRGLVLINSVPDQLILMCNDYDADGKRYTVNNFQAAFKAVQNPFVLLYTSGHWQAIVPK